MKLTINGKAYKTDQANTLDELMSEFRNSESHEGIAVAVDEEVIPKSQWDVYQIKDGSSIEVITAVQGG